MTISSINLTAALQMAVTPQSASPKGGLVSNTTSLYPTVSADVFANAKAAMTAPPPKYTPTLLHTLEEVADPSKEPESGGGGTGSSGAGDAGSSSGPEGSSSGSNSSGNGPEGNSSSGNNGDNAPVSGGSGEVTGNSGGAPYSAVGVTPPSTSDGTAAVPPEATAAVPPEETNTVTATPDPNADPLAGRAGNLPTENDPDAEEADENAAKAAIEGVGDAVLHVINWVGEFFIEPVSGPPVFLVPKQLFEQQPYKRISDGT
jgi:hypothetical protein